MKYDVIVIGAGPGGYVAAIKAAQAGLNVACVDKADLGGICLNWGCIPTKALLKSAETYQTLLHAEEYGLKVSGKVTADLSAIIDRSRKVAGTMSNGIDFLFKKNNVTHIKGNGRIIASNLVEVTDSEGAVETYGCDKVVIATGASPVKIPAFPVDGENIISYREALAGKTLPKKMLIIGAGAIGCEFAYFFNALGTEVHLVEMADQLLPVEDKDSSKVLKTGFKKQGINVYVSTKTKSVEVKKKGKINCILENAKGKETELTVDRVLVAVGMSANSAGLNLEAVGVATDARGAIIVNDYMQTTSENIYAIGDVAGRQMLAHKASFEAEVAVKHIAKGDEHGLNYGQVPGCTYCQPQVASVGMTEQAATDAGYELRIGKFPFSASGKAQAINHPEGMVKLIFDGKNDCLLGAHIVGYDATELIAELGLALRLEATYDEIAHTIHAHPTLSESVMEAAMDSHGESPHI